MSRRKRRRIKRARKDAVLSTPSFIPGIRGKNWDVHAVPDGVVPNTQNIMGERARMQVPTDDSPFSKYTRLHELLHAAISPLEQPRDVVLEDGEVVAVRGLLMAEEVRVEMISRSKLGMANLPERVDEITKEFLDAMMPLATKAAGTKYVDELLEGLLAGWMGSPSPVDNTYMIAQIRGWLTNCESSGDYTSAQIKAMWNVMNWLQDALDTILRNVWLEEIEDMFENNIVPPWPNVLKLGYFITKLFENCHNTQPEDNKAKRSFDDMPDMKRLADQLDQHNMEDPSERNRAEMQEWLPKPDRPHTPEVTHYDEKVEWGRMDTREPKRANRLPKTKVVRSKYTATDMGTHPKYVHRILIDGQPFARKRRDPGGSVLIDDSGSMGFVTAQIQEIVEAAPAVDIGAYSGLGGKGELVIISKDGTWLTVTEATRPSGYNNLVDMPALEWLAQQEEPKIWVSDGYVIPTRGGMEQAMEDCAEFCRRNNINRVDNVTEARDVFLGKKEIYR